jgi:hypothetical protein
VARSSWLNTLRMMLKIEWNRSTVLLVRFVERSTDLIPHASRPL